MTGGDRYKDRGIIPRAISYIFKQRRTLTANKTNIRDSNEIDMQRDPIPFKCFVSYLQVYNEQLYDLLSMEDRGKRIEKRKKLQVIYIFFKKKLINKHLFLFLFFFIRKKNQREKRLAFI